MNVDIRSSYLGLQLKSPLVVSASPLSAKVDTLRRLEDAGAAAAVLPSLFEEQLVHDQWAVHRVQEYNTEQFAESLDYFPEMEDYNTGPSEYLEHIAAAKRFVDIPIIASLNGSTKGGWVQYAKEMEQAGADALELNIYIVPTDPAVSSAEVENQYLELTAAVRQAIQIPMAVKVGPYFSSIPNMAERLVQAGANGLVLFNRFLHPDIDLETLNVEPYLELSQPIESLLSVRWIAILHGKIAASLAATSGAHSVDDIVRLLLAGADCAMLASILLRRGPDYLRTLTIDLRDWLVEHEYESVSQMQGSVSQQNCPNPEAFKRANYMKALTSYTGPFV